MYKIFQLLFWAILLTALSAQSQTKDLSPTPYKISIEPLEENKLPELQSYAFGMWNDYWVIIGGRKDGLHERQPFASFDEMGRNAHIIVYNSRNNEVYNLSIDSLPFLSGSNESEGITDQLKSSNIQFAQYKDYLFLIGGYGLNSDGAHETFNTALTIHLPTLISSIMEGRQYSRWLVKVQNDTIYQLCGGRAHILDDQLFLMGGHKFMGSYNPDGPDTGSGFDQQYSNSVRIFSIKEDIKGLPILHLDNVIEDSTQLRKRDFNALPFQKKQNKFSLIALSGVFRPDIDIPWLDNTEINRAHQVKTISTRKYFNQYHCASISIYDNKNETNDLIFFGGISQYDIEDGLLTNDYNVPFTKQISRFHRDAFGQWFESLSSHSMPHFLGAGAEFIPVVNNQLWKNGVLQLRSIRKNKELIGYIYGGIKSDSSNIFWINDGTQSTAHNALYGVYLERNKKVDWNVNEQSTLPYYFEVYPYLGSEALNISYYLENAVKDISYSIKTESGKTLIEEALQTKTPGSYNIAIKINGMSSGAILFVHFFIDGKESIQKIKIDKNN